MSQTSDQQEPTRLHAWLKRHKVIFETLATAVFTFASIFVAWLQWRTAETQIEISRRQSQPNIIVSTQHLKEANEASFSNEELHVQNVGGIAKNLKADVAVWFEFELFTSQGKKDSIFIPITGYYGAHFVNGEIATGILVRCKGHRNWAKFINFYDQLKERVKSAGLGLGYLNQHEYVKITYRDVFDEQHEQYYKASNIGSTQLSKQDGVQWVERYSDKVGKESLDIDTMTVDQLFERIKSEFELMKK